MDSTILGQYMSHSKGALMNSKSWHIENKRHTHILIFSRAVEQIDCGVLIHSRHHHSLRVLP